MILADTTIWSSSLPKSRTKNERLAALIIRGEIVCHPWVFGELILAGVTPTVATDLLTLEFLPVPREDQVYRFIRQYHPHGIGWVDVNLLVSCLEAGVQLWTNDRALRANAEIHGRSAPAS